MMYQLKQRYSISQIWIFGGVMHGILDIYVDYGFAHTYYNDCVWEAVFE